MFYHDSKLQYTVRVDTPNPLFAKALQQAIGGIEGEIRGDDAIPVSSLRQSQRT